MCNVLFMHLVSPSHHSKGMKMPDALRNATPMVSSISVDDHIQGWERQKEQVSSAPEGLHFGHYKAGISDEDIAAFDATMRSLP